MPDLLGWVEIGAVIFNVLYVWFAARENIWCWPFGIIGSALGVILFVESKLYAESILFSYYVWMGFYGWLNWKKNRENKGGDISVRHLSNRTNVFFLVGGYAGTVLLFFLLKTFTDAEMPLLDSYTTVFSFIATWMVARRFIDNWIYWIAIDALTVYLYSTRELWLMAALTLFLTIMAVVGYVNWNKTIKMGMAK